MTPLSLDISDDEIIAIVDQWARLLETEDYGAAFNFTEHVPKMKWSVDLIRQVIEGYGESRDGQHVTVAGRPTDITQRKSVLRWKRNAFGTVGEVWYDLNIDGFASDLTATLRLQLVPGGLVLALHDIHVM